MSPKIFGRTQVFLFGKYGSKFDTPELGWSVHLKTENHDLCKHHNGTLAPGHMSKFKALSFAGRFKLISHAPASGEKRVLSRLALAVLSFQRCKEEWKTLEGGARPSYKWIIIPLTSAIYHLYITYMGHHLVEDWQPEILKRLASLRDPDIGFADLIRFANPKRG